MRLSILLLFVLFGVTTTTRADNFVFATHNYPPYSYEEDGQTKGIAVDIVREAVKRTGHTTSIRILTWARAVEETKSGQVDGVFNAFKTREREEFLDFGKEVLVPVVMVFFARMDSSIVSGQIPGLTHVLVGRVNQQSYGPAFDTAVSDGTLKNVYGVNTNEQLAKMLLTKRIDVMVSERSVGRTLFKTLNGVDQIRELEPPVSSLPCYLAFTKAKDRSTLRDGFDRALKEMWADGSVDKIYNVYR